MHQALRPYVTTGVALVGASVIAVAPIAPTPPDLKLANPVVQAERAIELTANEIQNAFNALAFGGAQALVTLAQLPAPLVAQILGLPSDEAAALFLAGGALGLFGPLISGTGAIGTALQRIADSDNLEQLISNLIGVPGTLIDGVVNGGYGPDLDALLTGLSPIPVVAGGLLRGALPLGTVVGTFPNLKLILPGTFPTLQGLVETLFGLLNPAQMSTVSSLAVATPADTTVEDGVNKLLFAATAATLRIVTLVAPLLEPILGDEAATFLALGTVGLLGPLISGTGAVGTALQNIVNSDGIEGLVTALIGAPGTITDGVVNGGYGPNLLPLLPALSLVPGANAAFAPGLIQNPGFIYGVLPGGIGLKPNATGLSLLPPGTIAVLQGLVERVFSALPSAESINTTALKSQPEDQPDLKTNGLDGDNQDGLTLSENEGGTGLGAVDGPEVTPKKHRQRVELNVLKLNPLDMNSKDNKDAAEDVSDGGASATVKHRPGIGMTPVHDLVKRVLGGHDHENESSTDGAQEAAS